MARPQKISDEQICSATIDMLRMLGAGGSVQHIADRLGISQPAIFRRYGTKANLVTQSLLWWTAKLDWQGAFAEAADPARFREQLAAIGKTAMDVAERSIVAADAFRFLVSAKTPPPMVPLNLPSIPQLVDSMTAWLEKSDGCLVSAKDARAFALAFLGAVNMLSFMRHFMQTDGTPEIESVIEFLLSRRI